MRLATPGGRRRCPAVFGMECERPIDPVDLRASGFERHSYAGDAHRRRQEGRSARIRAYERAHRPARTPPNAHTASKLCRSNASPAATRVPSCHFRPAGSACATLAPDAGALLPEAALIVVDVQNDFADPQGSLFVQGAADILPLVNSEADSPRKPAPSSSTPRTGIPASTPHFAKDGGIWPVHCVAGSWGASFHPALSCVGPSVHKGANGEDGYSGFTMKRPGDGRDGPHRAGGAAPRPWDREGRRVRPGDRLLRQRDGARRRPLGFATRSSWMRSPR